MKIKGFQPVIQPQARILILGTFPGVKSLKVREYYGHPQNAFWSIMSALFGFPRNAPYQARIDCIRANAIALWDVCSVVSDPWRARRSAAG